MQPPPAADAWALQTVRRYWADFMAREPGALRGDDPEQLHRMRVAHRSLRTAIRAFAPLLPPDLVACDSDLGWIGRQLGQVRDLDVVLERLDAITVESGDATLAALRPALVDQRSRARERLLQALTSPRFEALVLRIARTLRQQLAPDRRPAESIARFAPRMLQSRHRALRKAARHLTPKSPSADFHDTRRRARRLRFVTEFVESLYGRPATEFLDAVTSVQRLLGEHQDCYVGIELRRRGAGRLPAPTLRALRKLDRQDLRRAATLRKRTPDALRRLRRPWKALVRAMEAQSREEQSAPAVTAR